MPHLPRPAVFTPSGSTYERPLLRPSSHSERKKDMQDTLKTLSVYGLPVACGGILVCCEEGKNIKYCNNSVIKRKRWLRRKRGCEDRRPAKSGGAKMPGGCVVLFQKMLLETE